MERIEFEPWIEQLRMDTKSMLDELEVAKAKFGTETIIPEFEYDGEEADDVEGLKTHHDETTDSEEQRAKQHHGLDNNGDESMMDLEASSTMLGADEEMSAGMSLHDAAEPPSQDVPIAASQQVGHTAAGVVDPDDELSKLQSSLDTIMEEIKTGKMDNVARVPELHKQLLKEQGEQLLKEGEQLLKEQPSNC